MPTNNIHAERLKAIRKFVSFDYDLRKPLSSAAKRKIKKYHDEISALTNRPYQVFRSVNRQHVEQAQEFSQHEHKLPGLKVAFLPTDGANRVRLIFNKKGVKAKTKYVEITDVRLSVAQLIKDPIAHVNERIAGNPAKQYTIQAGRYEIPRPYLPESVAQGVARLTGKYHDRESNHYFGRWLHGLKAYTFADQGSIDEYLQTKKRSIEHGKKDRKRARNRRNKKGNHRG